MSLYIGGIYQIKNCVNGKSYIGSTIDLKRRKQEHFYILRNNTHDNIHLQRAYNKYGKNNFKFNVLLKCANNELIMAEQIFMNVFKPEYNIRSVAKNNLGFKHSNETKEKIGKIHKGKKLSKEHIEKLKQVQFGNTYVLGFKHSKQSKEKNRIAHLGKKASKETILKRSKPIIQYSLNDVFIKEFESAKTASIILKINRGYITQCCRYYAGFDSKIKSCKGYVFKYKL